MFFAPVWVVLILIRQVDVLNRLVGPLQLVNQL
jgi:hypothetical protein